MSYTITVVNQSPIVIQNGAYDTTTSLTLVGKNYPNYGQLLQQDLVNLLQNWAGINQPVNPVVGQLWWNTTVKSMQVYTGAAFKNVGGATVSATAPTGTAVQGDLWYKSDDQILYVYSGNAWILVGPTFTNAQGQTNAIAVTITDNVSGTHFVLAFYVNNLITGILSKDPSFVPVSGTTADGKTISVWSGFSTINPGYNVNSTILGAQGSLLTGTVVTNAQPYITSLGTLSGLTVATPISGSVQYNANTVTYATQSNITSVGTLTSLTVSGTGTFNGVVNHNSTTNLGYTNISANLVPVGANTSVTVGNISNWFNTVYAKNFVGTSVFAQYADLAENYLSDDLYEPGTVVEFGGNAEITFAVTPSGTNVAGVISSNPAYLMNQNDNPFMLPVALQGRVPCKVVGPVNKGDLLVSNGAGAAMATAEPKVGSVIGKALQSIADTNIQTIEVVVGVR
jgi:hypothetical protein